MTGRAEPDIRVFPDAASLSRAAADMVLAAALRASASHGRFSLVLSGGSTPRTLYSLLAEHPWRETIPWPKTHLFWADERCVLPAHPDSNYRLAAETFLDRVSVPPGNVHRIRGEEGPDHAAAKYEEEVRAFFGAGMPAFDLVLLGMGEDGHTASLFPRSAQLAQQDRLVLPVPLDASRRSRVTLSLPALNSARGVLFLVSGAAKAGAMRRVFGEGAPGGLPAARVRPAAGTVVWLLDREAAGGLPATLPADAAASVARN